MELLTDVKGKYRRQYTLPRAVEPLVDKKVQEWYDNGCIDDSTADATWNSSLMVAFRNKPPPAAAGGPRTQEERVPPRPAKPRIVLDFRHINAHLLLDSITQELPVPRIQEIYEKIRGFKFATTLDLRAAYQQLPVHLRDQVKTTFTWRGRRYKWKRWPFGLKPATGKFQKAILYKTISGMCERLSRH